MTDLDTTVAAQVLESHPDYRVLRRMVVTDDFGLGPARSPAQAVVVDTETTGIDTSADRIIELGMVRFEYDTDTHAIHRVVAVYDALEDPGRPIPPESTAIHHITDDMVAGQRIDEPRVHQMLAGVRLVIAHNASFDRVMLERRMPVFATLPWGCSLNDVPWAEEGFPGGKLEYLANCHGLFYEGHRSEIDCRAVVEVLRRPLRESGTPALRRLLERSAQASYRIWAIDSPFDTKDLLKTRGYRWNADARCWTVTVAANAGAAELAWLKQEVYGGASREIEIEKIDATVRWSARSGKRQKRKL